MVDVTVRGAGIFGLSTAWACLQMGAKVRVVDPHGVGAGASGGVVGALAPHVPENWNPKKAFQFASLIEAPRFWAEVEAVAGLSAGYARTGRIQPLADDKAVEMARSRAASADAFWEGKAVWRVQRASEGNWSVRSASGLQVFDDLSALIHPRKACSALAAAVLAKGGQISASAADKGLVLHATGAAGLAELTVATGRPVGQGIKGQAALLEHDAKGKPQIFADGVHVIPHADGTVAVGSTTEREYEQATSTDQRLDEVIEAARRAVPSLAKAPVVERWAALRPRAASRAPLLGPWPGRAGHFIANGGFKIGFGMAPRCARVMAELMLTGSDEIPVGFRTDELA